MLKRFFLLLVTFLGVESISAQTFPVGFGATPFAGSMGTGTTFRVWAGAATSVYVVGTFNSWSTTANSLTREGSSEIWSANIQGARAGHQYHFLMNGHVRRRDPRGARIVEYNNNDAIIYDQNAYAWKSGEFTPPPLESMVIYELHVGTFNDPNPEQGGSASLDDAREKLDYIASLGANAVKIMPVTEFPGTHSWGYNPTDLFAVDNLTYGGPDALKRFVDAAHQRGIAVILDIVHNHYGSGDTNDLARSLWEFDGTPGALGGGMYFYQDAIKARTQWGPRPNYNNAQVQHFIKDNVRTWLRDYRIDGFRWDATKYIRLATNGSVIAEGETLLREVNTIIRNEFTNRISIAEDLQQLPSTTASTNTGGLAFHSDWQTEVHFALVQELSTNTAPDVGRILSASALNYTSHTRRVVYTESHDEVGLKNGKHRVPFRMNPANPTGKIARQKSLLAAGLMMTTPGIPMLFQGQEMLETKQFDDTNAVNWALISTNAGIVSFYKDVIRLRQNYFGNTGGLTGAFVNAQMQTLTNGIDQLMTIHRRNNGGVGDDVFVVANVSAKTNIDEWVTFPSTGEWYAVLNSDNTKYGGEFGNIGLGQTRAFFDSRGLVRLAPWSFIVYARAPLPSTTYNGMAVSGPFRSWDPGANMTRWQDHIWSVDLSLSATNRFEFKFFANSAYDTGWGPGSINTNSWPVTGNAVVILGGDNFAIAIPETGDYRFTFNSGTGRFEIRRIKPTPIITRHPNMAAAGDFNGFNLVPNMGLNGAGLWTGTFAAVRSDDLKFKFAAYGTWDISWGGFGEINQLPASGFAYRNPGDDLKIAGPVNGVYSFTFNDVTGAYTVEKTGPPPPYPSMQIIGAFNDWTSFAQMTSNGLHQWRYTTVANRATDLEFRIAANNTGYDMAWGSTNPIGSTLPAAVPVRLGLSSNIVLRGPLYGTYTIDFDSQNWTVSASRSAPPPYPAMGINGSFNGWNSNSFPAMTSNGLHQWSYTLSLTEPTALEFKFNTSLTNWSRPFGINVTHPHILPISGIANPDAAGDNEKIKLQGPLDGIYTINFNSDTLSYSISRIARPAFYGAMAVAGDFNGWSTISNMQFNVNNEWVLVTNLNQSSGINFKFAANGNWDVSWGDAKPHSTNALAAGVATNSANINIPGPFSGRYVFTFNDRNLSYRLAKAGPPPLFELDRNQTRASGNRIFLYWPGNPGSTYTIQRSTDLSLGPPGFTNIATNVPSAFVQNVFTVNVGNAASEYYRVQGQ